MAEQDTEQQQPEATPAAEAPAKEEEPAAQDASAANEAPQASAEAEEESAAATEEDAEAQQEEATADAGPEEADTDDDEAQAEDGQPASSERAHRATIEELLKAGVHFGHLTSRWHPRMEPYIFMHRNNIHIIDLMQTQVLLDRAADAAERFARRGKSILFTGTKKQAQEIVRKYAEECGQPFMVERWLGGTMTNFQTIRRSIRRMEDIEKMEKDGTLDKLKKKERLMRLREHEKLENTLGGIRQMASLPGALFVVDIKRENIAVSEANKLGIPIIAMVDTNCNPEHVEYPIPANDDALSSIELVTSIIARAVQEGTGAREAEQQAKKQSQQKQEQEA